MRVVVQSGFGPATKVLSIEDAERPSAPRDGALVRVKAVGLPKGSWLMTHGLPYIARPAYGWRVPRQRVAGLQLAGTVEAVGEEVRDVSPGDEVFGLHPGALSEWVAVPSDALVRRPANVRVEQAASAPTSGITALQAVRDAGQVQPGQRVLVLGASGSVGSFVVQVARAFGAHVTGVASARNHSLLRQLGAEHVIDYTREDPLASGRPYDVIIDLAGNRAVSRLRRALTPTGALVIVGGTGGRWTLGFQRTVGGMLLAPFVSQRIVGLIAAPGRADLVTLAEMMAAGTVTPVVQGAYPLAATAEAMEAVGSGHGAGTVVVVL